VKAYSLTIRSRVAAFLVVIGATAAALAIAFAGLVLLALLVAAGAVLALGAAIYLKLRGRKATRGRIVTNRADSLDPANEIFVEQKKQIGDRV